MSQLCSGLLWHGGYDQAPGPGTPRKLTLGQGLMGIKEQSHGVKNKQDKNNQNLRKTFNRRNLMAELSVISAPGERPS